MEHLGFIKRLSNSLFSPKDVIPYRTDKWWITLLYFIFLLVLSILPLSISVVRGDVLGYETKKEIKSFFHGKEEILFSIKDGKLVHDDNNYSYTYAQDVTTDISIIFSLSNSIETELISAKTYVIFKETGVYLSQSAMHIKLFEYNEYTELDNFDFGDLSNSNSPSWDTIFTVAIEEINKVKPTITIMSIIMLAASETMTLLFISLMLAFFQSFTLTKIISFGQTWKMCIYLLTPYVIGNVLAMLFNLSILFYLGLAMTALYAASLSQRILREKSGRNENNDL